ncbi:MULTISPECIES: DUF1707 domain-containing protein [Streptomyces]|uniref:DUF1707 domain-containing protein n=1 Tax=Streptomyces lichenis TaxID=2306967 RepID=A0ABT0I5N1_9ACTN|nr:DUF1707 domain-containing protein [Streptomyces lichenis]MCK8676618.1 DUF1707 domain-containing protein [Streptomyces lichenis]
MTDELPAMRASDAEREQTAERLREAMAEGRLDMAEFQERLDAAYTARTRGELVPLVRDLPVAGSGAVPEGLEGPGHSWVGRVGKPATSRGGFAFWGGFGRRGKWTIGRTFTGVAIQAGGEVDLREADFEDRETVIRCFALMGGIVVTVPPELHVEVTGLGFMGGFDDRGAGEGTPGSPRVRITGFALMGGVGVERKRRKGEKKRLEKERQAGELEG